MGMSQIKCALCGKEIISKEELGKQTPVETIDASPYFSSNSHHAAIVFPKYALT